MAGMSCGVSETNLVFSLLMYSSYAVLFARFFYTAYLGQTKHKPVQTFEEKKKTLCAEDAKTLNDHKQGEQAQQNGEDIETKSEDVLPAEEAGTKAGD